MINTRLIFKILGALLNIEAAFMALCLVMSLCYQDDDMIPLTITVVVTVIAAIAFGMHICW